MKEQKPHQSSKLPTSILFQSNQSPCQSQWTDDASTASGQTPNTGRSWIHKLLSSEETVVFPKRHVQKQQTHSTGINSNTELLTALSCPLNSKQGVQWSNPTLCLYTVPVLQLLLWIYFMMVLVNIMLHLIPCLKLLIPLESQTLKSLWKKRSCLTTLQIKIFFPLSFCWEISHLSTKT